ncbi:MAG: glycosyltransferase [Clostridia bacterium]|nr:glycosyltransferase [Clostridia bacterium]
MSLYDREDPRHLDESLQSMVGQTVKPDQIVLVKDGPVNPSLEEVIEAHKKANPDLFTIVPLAENTGLANALNNGLKHCRNEYVARMDTDDISIPERCEKELAVFMGDDTLSLIGSNVDEFSNDPDVILSRRVVPSSEEDILKFSRRRNPFNHPTVMFKKSAIEGAGGYDVNCRRAQDFELFVTMLHSGYHARNIDESLVKFRADPDSYGRKKKWSHCKTYISVVRGFWKKGYSSLSDYLIVLAGQITMFVLPKGMTNRLFKKMLRKDSK